MKHSLRFFILGGFFYLLICGFQSQDQGWPSFAQSGEKVSLAQFSNPRISWAPAMKTPVAEKKPAEAIASLLSAADFFSRFA